MRSGLDGGHAKKLLLGTEMIGHAQMQLQKRTFWELIKRQCETQNVRSNKSIGSPPPICSQV